ncbi:MAG: diacylglycerol/lipid kinase family protein [Anaerolineae bacterium]
MAKEELRVIVNPTAAHGAVGREWPEMRSFFRQQGMAFRDALTEAPGHATELARQAIEEGYSTIVAVGGDGTVNEVVNGLVDGSDVGYGKVPAASLAVISRGTGCDLVRTLGMRRPLDTMHALARRQVTRTIDLGEIVMEHGGKKVRRLFINVAGLGFDGEVVEGLLQRGDSKRGGGTIPYLMQVVRTVMHYDNKKVRARIDGLDMEGLYTAFFACNGKYLAGGMRIAPGAEVNDGLFDVVVVGPLSRPGLLARLPTIYFGWHTIFPQIRIYRAKQLQVDTEDRLLIQADGELVGTAPATMRIIPQALRVRV